VAAVSIASQTRIKKKKLLFDVEEGKVMMLLNVDDLLADYTSSHPRR
jgi:hypothetical protein